MIQSRWMSKMVIEKAKHILYKIQEIHSIFGNEFLILACLRLNCYLFLWDVQSIWTLAISYQRRITREFNLLWNFSTFLIIFTPTKKKTFLNFRICIPLSKKRKFSSFFKWMKWFLTFLNMNAVQAVKFHFIFTFLNEKNTYFAYL